MHYAYTLFKAAACVYVFIHTTIFKKNLKNDKQIKDFTYKHHRRITSQTHSSHPGPTQNKKTVSLESYLYNVDANTHTSPYCSLCKVETHPTPVQLHTENSVAPGFVDRSRWSGTLLSTWICLSTWAGRNRVEK